jgi:hypothetical protein
MGLFCLPLFDATNDGDRGAVETNENVQVIEDDAQESKDSGSVFTTGLLGLLTALDRCCGAVASRNAAPSARSRSGSGDASDGGESDENGGELHFWVELKG